MALSRKMKQFVIAGISALSIVLIAIGIYFSFLKPPETCFDGRQNQDEQGVDCGGTCQAVCKENITALPVEITEIAFVQSRNGQYDILGKIHNPNDEIGASTFVYTALLKDGVGNVLAVRSGKSYILPQENKYLLELNLLAETEPVTASLEISEIEWERFSGFQEKPSINIYQKRYSPISSGAGFGEAYGLLSNESPYDFRSIIVRVILRDATGKPLAFNATEMRTVKSREERDFRLVWPSAFSGTVERIEMEVDADVYHSDNFIRQYLPGGRYQEFISPKAY